MEKITISTEKSFIIDSWKVKKNQKVTKNTVLCLYKFCDSNDVQRLKSSVYGNVKELLVECGVLLDKGLPILTILPCQHLVVMKQMCAECGVDLKSDNNSNGQSAAAVSMVHSVPELTVSMETAIELGQSDEIRLLSQRRLVLLVDLDQTLVHTTNDNIPSNLLDVYHFQLWSGAHNPWYHTKFRPGVEKFLQNISSLYELHICTFGVRVYAHSIARFLDPDGRYFSHRILSRDECFNPNSKTANLRALFPQGDHMVCIIDDREDVWKYAANLVHVKPYIYFEGTADIHAPPALTKVEPHIPLKRKVKIHRRSLDDRNSVVGAQKEVSNISEKESKITSSVTLEADNKLRADAVKDFHTTEEDNQLLGTLNSSETVDTVPDLHNAGDSVNSSETVDTVPDLHNAGDSVNDVSMNERNAENLNVLEDNSLPINIVEKHSNEGVCTEVRNLSDKEVVENENGKKVIEKLEGEESIEKSSSEKVIEKSSDEEMIEKLSGEEIIEWEDTDDYLIYLEDILRRVHTAFYEMHDQIANSGNNQHTSVDVKKVVPYLKRKVLHNTHIVFSGVIPTNQAMEQSRVYRVAVSLGAVVETNVGPETTHLVAAKWGTQKVYEAKRHKKIHMVTPEWLWCCYERWERVDERLFNLKREGSKLNDSIVDSPRPVTPTHTADNVDDTSVEQQSVKLNDKVLVASDMSSDNCSAISTNTTAILSATDMSKCKESNDHVKKMNIWQEFTLRDIEEMDNQVDEALAESSSESSDEEQVKRCHESSEDETESLSEECPRGWKKRIKLQDERASEGESSRDDWNESLLRLAGEEGEAFIKAISSSDEEQSNSSEDVILDN